MDASKLEKKQVFSILFNISKIINSNVDRSTLLHYIAREISGLFNANSCSIMLFDEESKSLTSKAAYGLTEREMNEIVFKPGQGVAGWVALHGATALIADVEKDKRFEIIKTQLIKIRSLLCIPLRARDNIIGVISITSDIPEFFDARDEELLIFLGTSIVLDIENARLFKLAVTDGLTQAYNRQFLCQRLSGEVERAKRYKTALSIILFDIDDFKKVNDSNSHLAGDYILTETIKLVQKHAREADVVIRYGGEEFLIILPNTSQEGAIKFANRIRQTIDEHEFLWSNKKLKITISVGVASMTEEKMTDETLVKMADLALYQAKSKGKNCTEFFQMQNPA